MVYSTCKLTFLNQGTVPLEYTQSSPQQMLLPRISSTLKLPMTPMAAPLPTHLEEQNVVVPEYLQPSNCLWLRWPHPCLLTWKSKMSSPRISSTLELPMTLLAAPLPTHLEEQNVVAPNIFNPQISYDSDGRTLAYSPGRAKCRCPEYCQSLNCLWLRWPHPCLLPWQSSPPYQRHWRNGKSFFFHYTI